MDDEVAATAMAAIALQSATLRDPNAQWHIDTAIGYGCDRRRSFAGRGEPGTVASHSESAFDCEEAHRAGSNPAAKIDEIAAPYS
jgi:hypothetical protein